MQLNAVFIFFYMALWPCLAFCDDVGFAESIVSPTLDTIAFIADAIIDGDDDD